MAAGQVGRKLTDRILGSLRSLSRRGFGRIVAAGAIESVAATNLALTCQPARAIENSDGVSAGDAKPGEGLSFSGRVIDLETGNPVENAAIIIERSLRDADPRTSPSWIGQSTVRSGADGRFELVFPPEQVADQRLKITLRVRHADYIPRKSWETDLATILRRQALGDRPFFETVRLERGVEYTAQIVTPTGEPAAGLRFFFENWSAGSNDSRGFHNDDQGRTGADGWFRLRSPKSQSVALFILAAEPPRASFPYAPYRHFWGTDRPSKHLDAPVPTNLGKIVLDHGVRVAGRLVDREGRPIGGQKITAYRIFGRTQHSATTEADGSFVLGPLACANYWIYGQGQEGFLYGHHSWIYGERDGGSEVAGPPGPGSLSQPRTVMPEKIYIKEGTAPEPLVLRELPTVEVVIRFLDSRGNPRAGGRATIEGTIPSVPGARQSSLIWGSASSINNPEPEDFGNLLEWRMHGRSDADGRIVFRAPKGLQDASLRAFFNDETNAYKTRLDDNGPLTVFGGGDLGELNGDRTVTVVTYRAPTVLVSVKTEDGVTPANLKVGASFTLSLGHSYGNSFIRQTDGRFRGSLMPDHEYRIGATADDYVPRTVPRLRLAEGELTEVTMTLRKRPKPPETGKPAPPFSVVTIEGRKLTLDDLQGKFALLHFWAPNPNIGLAELPHLKAVADRVREEGRLTIVSLCLVHDREDSKRLVEASGLPMVQVVLRDYGLAPIAVDYAAYPTPKSFLIGPDGTLIAKDLKGDQIELAVSAHVCVEMSGRLRRRATSS